jgi:ATP-binding cassette subfamily F protein uup
MQQSKLKSLSGGEKKRLFLLSSLMFGANFIILDEPTNDLDIRTLEILEDYLDAFQGCILTVSHDRFLLDRVVDYLIIFTKEGIIKFPGNYSDYLLVKRFREEEAAAKIVERKVARDINKPRKMGYMQKRELGQIEKQMEINAAELEKLVLQIETDATTMSSDDFLENTQKQEAINSKQEILEERWLELQEIEE